MKEININDKERTPLKRAKKTSGKNKPTLFGLAWEGSFDFIPSLIASVILLGTVYINSYYFFGYGFRVGTYLEISEILLLSFVDLGGVFDETILLILMVTLPFYFFAKRINGSLLIVKTGILVIATEYLIAYLLTTTHLKSKVNLTSGNYATFIYLLIISFLLYYIFTFIRPVLEKIQAKIDLFYMPYSVLCFLTIVSIKNYSDINILHNTYKSKIVTDKDTLISDSSFYYVGKTKNYVFMWSARDTAMTVIPMSDIKKLVIHNTLPDKKPTPKPKNKKILPSMAIKNDSSKTLKK
ncbi:hypothetical protein [Runella zeae]|uniref:hypothetical protein n=1 Tax=Runella zeae TaxID=94255 RepID=UPI000421CCB0|nr:hypothetical protein [Runella zeae]